MKNFTLRIALLLIATLSAFASVWGQDLPPVVVKPPVTTLISQPSLSDLAPTERFLSTEGAFFLSLPKSYDVAVPAPVPPGQQASGHNYVWKLREGVIIVGFMDFKDPNFDASSDKGYADYIAGFKAGVIQMSKATVTAERALKLGKLRGHEFTFHMPSGQTELARSFVAGKHTYALVAIISSEVAGARALIEKAFDSFELVDRSKAMLP